MNHYFPDWNIIESDLPAASQRKPLRLDQELVELLWENGQVVHNNQTHKNQGLDQNESRKVSKCNQSSNHVEGSSAENLAQENELISWNHHCQVDDPFEKELSSFLLPEFIPISSNSSLINDSPIDNTYKFCNTEGPQISHLLPYTSHSENLCVNSSLSPQVQAQPHANFSGIVGTINKRAPNINGCGFGSIGGSVKMREVKENSGKTVGSSHCGSNQVIYDADISLASCSGIGREVFNTTPEEEDFGGKVASKSETIAGSLSSGGSGFTTWNQSTGTNSSKRKSRETENSESQSEAALLEPVTRKKTAQEHVTTRKLRASEVHNLSERRRRDRINEKMRALQELLPRSNQTDKASMLDEAIQYMKSLQLQLQMMWMGSQMAPLMYPPYMSRLEMGISPQMLPTLQSAMNLSRLPMMDQARANQAAIMNYQNQLQNYNFSDQYGAYVGFYPPVHSANQQMNMYTSYGPNMVQQNHTLPPAGDANNIGPPA